MALLVAAVVVAGAIAQYEARASADGWPGQIVVDGRDYLLSGAVTSNGLSAPAADWREVDLVGPDRDPAFAPPLVAGTAPTELLVATSPVQFVAYSLVSGP